MTRLKDILAILCAALSMVLFGLNLIGEVKTLRVVEAVPASEFLFDDDISLEVSETLAQIKKRSNETDLEFSIRLTTVVQQSLGHLDSWFSAPPDLYSQRVPASENLWLHLAGHLSSEPEVIKFHFADYRKTLERGIGICGDHANMVSQVLWENDIPNSIFVFEPHEKHLERGGHVVVEVRAENELPYLLDADFGVVVENSVDNPEIRRSKVYQQFMNAGYGHKESSTMSDIMGGNITVFGSTWEIMTKRYVLEKVTYVFKWLAPILLLALFLVSPVRKKLIATPIPQTLKT